MTIKDTKLDIRTTTDTKEILEQAANTLGINLSASLLDSAMMRALQVIEQSRTIYLNHEEAERFVTALENPPKPNEKLRELLKNISK